MEEARQATAEVKEEVMMKARIICLIATEMKKYNRNMEEVRVEVRIEDMIEDLTEDLIEEEEEIEVAIIIEINIHANLMKEMTIIEMIRVEAAEVEVEEEEISKLEITLWSPGINNKTQKKVKLASSQNITKWMIIRLTEMLKTIMDLEMSNRMNRMILSLVEEVEAEAIKIEVE